MQPSDNPLRIEPRATEEVQELALWFYFAGPEGLRGPEAMLRFELELDETYDRIQAYPETPGFYTNGFRRAYFTLLPCMVLYEVYEDETVVYSVAHAHADPDKLKQRLEETRRQGLREGNQPGV